MFNVIIGITIFLATYNSLKVVFQQVNEQRAIKKISQAPSHSFVKNKEQYIKKRFKENINILNNLKINTEEKGIAQKENETILFNLKELISTTKIKKEDFNIEENTEQIKQYLTVLNTTR